MLYSYWLRMSKNYIFEELYEAWWAAVHGVAKSRTWLSDWTTTMKKLMNNLYIYIYIYIFLGMCVCVSCSVMSGSLWPMDCNLTGSSVYRFLQARILERVAITFFRGSSWLRDWTWVSCIPGRFFTIWATRLYNEVNQIYISPPWTFLPLLQSYPSGSP